MADVRADYFRALRYASYAVNVVKWAERLGNSVARVFDEAPSYVRPRALPANISRFRDARALRLGHKHHRMPPYFRRSYRKRRRGRHTVPSELYTPVLTMKMRLHSNNDKPLVAYNGTPSAASFILYANGLYNNGAATAGSAQYYDSNYGIYGLSTVLWARIHVRFSLREVVDTTATRAKLWIFAIPSLPNSYATLDDYSITALMSLPGVKYKILPQHATGQESVVHFTRTFHMKHWFPEGALDDNNTAQDLANPAELVRWNFLIKKDAGTETTQQINIDTTHTMIVRWHDRLVSVID